MLMVVRYNWSDPAYSPISDMERNTMEYLLFSASHPLQYTFSACALRNRNVNCLDTLDIVKTDAGAGTSLFISSYYNSTVGKLYYLISNDFDRLEEDSTSQCT